MHRIRTIVAGAAGLLLSATAAGAQGTTSTRPFDIGLLGGASVPLGDFADGAEVGFHVGGFVGFRLSETSPLKLRAEVAWNRFGVKEGAFDDGEDIDVDIDGSASILGITGNVVYTAGTQSQARPYFMGGAGVYRLKVSAEAFGFEISDSQTKFGFNAGAGVEFPLSGFTSFVEARFHSVMTDESSTNFVPISFGVRF